MSGQAPPLSLDLSVICETPVPDRLDERSLHSLVTHILASERAAGAWTVCVVFTTDDALQRLHAQFMGLDSPTDIMTFPYDERAGDPSRCELGGDIVISVDRARAQAGDDAWDLETELRFLAAHGLLHLLGWDDHTPEDRQAMLDRQRALLSDASG